MSFLFRILKKRGFLGSEQEPEGPSDDPSVSLVEAIDSNDVDAVRAILEKYPPVYCPGETNPLNVNFVIKDNLDNTPATIACLRNNLEIMQLLLTRDDLNLSLGNIYGSTPLHLACLSGRAEVAKLLLADGRVEHDLSDVDNSSPLWDAAYGGHIQTIKWVIASNRPVDMSKKGKMLDIDTMLTTPLEIALRNGHVKTAELLEWFLKDEEGCRRDIRKELNVTSFPVIDPLRRKFATKLFVLMVLLSDHYLLVSEENESANGSAPSEPKLEDIQSQIKRGNARKFFKMAVQLPQELQMVLANRAYRLQLDLIYAAQLNVLFSTKWGF